MICKYIALFVPDLRAAESYYRELFGMELLFREARTEESWGTLPPDKDWEDAARAGLELEMVALERSGFVLALFQGGPQPPGNVLEICFGLPPDEVAAVLSRLPEDAVVVRDNEGRLKFDDRFGYRWTLDEPQSGFESYGEAEGKWLDV
jgi:catechol 2,3-dioxygenase-like lactoylglutathione lyase family enzyme